MDYTRRFYDPIQNVVIKVEAGSVQIFLRERDFDNWIPATRLSDGTLRFLSLLAVLLHPSAPPLVVIEEPELGLHPDAISLVAELLKDAATRTQLVVTTHSDLLVSAIGDPETGDPENVVVCEKADGVTKLNRLSGDELKSWLEEYSLGELWLRGQVGGVRW